MSRVATLVASLPNVKQDDRGSAGMALDVMVKVALQVEDPGSVAHGFFFQSFSLLMAQDVCAGV